MKKRKAVRPKPKACRAKRRRSFEYEALLRLVNSINEIGAAHLDKGAPPAILSTKILAAQNVARHALLRARRPATEAELIGALEENGRLRTESARWARGVKAVLGLEHWPEIPGDFKEGVMDLLRKRLVASPGNVEALEAAQADIRAFHVLTGLVVREYPDLLAAPETLVLRRNLIEEEAREAIEAIESPPHATSVGEVERLARIAKELADVIVVTLGTAVSLGIDLGQVWAEVHRSNMAKAGPDGKIVRRADGKILKPLGWRPPDIASIIQAQLERVA